jgi:hypothetical protein
MARMGAAWLGAAWLGAAWLGKGTSVQWWRSRIVKARRGVDRRG